MRQLRHSTTAAFLRKAIYETGRRKDEEKKKRKATRTKGSKEEEEEEEGAKSSNLIMNKNFWRVQKKVMTLVEVPLFASSLSGWQQQNYLQLKKAELNETSFIIRGKMCALLLLKRKIACFSVVVVVVKPIITEKKQPHHRQQEGRRKSLKRTCCWLGFYSVFFSLVCCVCVCLFMSLFPHISNNNFQQHRMGWNKRKFHFFLFSLDDLFRPSKTEDCFSPIRPISFHSDEKQRVEWHQTQQQQVTLGKTITTTTREEM